MLSCAAASVLFFINLAPFKMEINILSAAVAIHVLPTCVLPIMFF